MNNVKTWVSTLLTLAFVGFIGTVAILTVKQNVNIVEIVRARPLVILSGTAIVCFLGGILIFWRSLDSEYWNEPERREREFDIIKIIVVTTVAVVAGSILITAASTYADAELQNIAVRTATGWALAYFASAFLVGFLFGIPKVVEDNGKRGKSKQRSDIEDSSDYEQRANTNLEQISDWLTKIIVGLGLVELKKIPSYLYQLSKWMASSICCPANDCGGERTASFCSAFIIFFASIGFLSGYLLSRMFLPGAFRRAEAPPRKVTDKEGGAFADSEKVQNTDAERIRSFWKPNKKTDANAENMIKSWLGRKGLDISIPMFMRDIKYVKERTEFIKEVLEKPDKEKLEGK